jgi:mutator protein MutT
MAFGEPLGAPVEAPSERFGSDLRHRVEANLARFERRSLEPDGRRAAAVALALVPDAEGRACFVLTRRARTLNAHAGQWALPGGRIDAGETAEDAVRRELAEEVGLVVGEGALLGALDDYGTRSGYIITPIVVWAEEPCELCANPGEVAAVYRIPLAELDRPGVPRLIAIPESERPVIQVPLYDSLIHAPTAAIMYQMREVAVHGRATRVDHLEQPVWAWR